MVSYNSIKKLILLDGMCAEYTRTIRYISRCIKCNPVTHVPLLTSRTKLTCQIFITNLSALDVLCLQDRVAPTSGTYSNVA